MATKTKKIQPRARNAAPKVTTSATPAAKADKSKKDAVLDMLKRMKFEAVGFHPVEDRALNVVEQINQTWTYFVAASAAKQLLELHPDVGGFYLAPGANASLELDIMSVAPGAVGAETFAAVDPRNNRKLYLDLQKMAARSERHRYVFFMSPLYPEAGRQAKLERDGVEVWSLPF